VGRVIQEVQINKTEKLFIIDFNLESRLLIFRTSYEPNYKQQEIVVIDGDKVRTNLYFFHIAFLNKFISENY